MAEISGGDKLRAALDDIARNLKRGGTVKVGFLEGATYPDGTSVPLVAALNEFGHGVKSKEGDYYQLPRPFFRRMVAEKSGEWPKAIEGLLVANNYDARKVLELTGAAIAGQLRQSIVDLVDPPLAASTIARKGSSKPLVDTGHMLASVEYEVESGGSVGQYHDPKMTGTFTNKKATP